MNYIGIRPSVQFLKDDFYDKQRHLVAENAAQSQQIVNLKSWLQENAAAVSM